ncbi:MAG TPA: hypothetical protein DIC42_01615 [Holosporales bacterium]|nr:hypothetical protein [Holosporales bacterium]
MKKTVLLGFVSLATLSITSNVMGSDVTSLLKKAFPESMFTSKCTASNAKINWNLVAQAEQAGGAKAIQQKVQDRVTPCLSASNPNYQKQFQDNCAIPSASSNAKNQVCGGGKALMQQQQNPFGMQAQDDPQSAPAPQPQGGLVAQQQAVMGTPVPNQADIQALEARMQTVEQQAAQIMTFLKQLYPYIQQLDAKVTQIQR